MAEILFGTFSLTSTCNEIQEEIIICNTLRFISQAIMLTTLHLYMKFINVKRSGVQNSGVRTWEESLIFKQKQAVKIFRNCS